MLTTEQNDLLTRTGPGTPMGETLRRYWLPALLASELPAPDCPPVRVRLLGEQLVAFRDTSGRVGLLEELCAHRGASLWLGRNEECGLRCVFHGWKYDVDGNCVDMMNEPDSERFRQKVKQPSYPTVELGGIVWAYMGPRDKQPAPPAFAWTQAPESQRHVTKVLQESNWLQALEGGLDTSHAPILHRTLKTETTHGGNRPDSPLVQATPPLLEVEVTDYGYRYFGVRSMASGQRYVRGYHYVAPFTQIRPESGGGETKSINNGHYWVPVDDHHCMVYNWQYRIDGQALTDEEREERGYGNTPGVDVDVERGFRSFRNKTNAYGIDRQVQKTETFSGIEGVNTQDRAVQESMGEIVDRAKEHLGPADKAVIMMRQLLQGAVRTVQDGGDPPGVQPTYYQLQATSKILPPDEDWHEALLREMERPGAARQ